MVRIRSAHSAPRSKRFAPPLIAIICGCSIGLSSAAPHPTAFVVLHDFSATDGYSPVLSLATGTGNVIYGSAPAGGAESYGTVFKMNRDGSGFDVVHSFSPADQYPTPTILPGCRIILGNDGVLYGTAQGGTNSLNGMIFKVKTDGSDYTILHGFTNADKGPFSLIQGNDELLYGSGMSCVFKLDTNGTNYAVLHTFDSAVDGRFAYGKLVQGADGALYGAAQVGGTNSNGTIFKLDTDGSNFTVLHTFGPAPDGRQPYGGLIQGGDGFLYGTTIFGGSNNLGTVFKLSTDGTVYEVFHHFQGGNLDGANPYSALVQGLNSLLYGTSSAGGTNGNGTIFEMHVDGSGYAVLHDFGSGGSSTPYAGLVQGPASDGSGVLYGMTSAGGSHGGGTLFGIVVNPPLSITPLISESGGRPVVIWPAWALGYGLQMSTNPASGSWDPATNGVPVTGLQLTNSVPGAFYRLIWKP